MNLRILIIAGIALNVVACADKDQGTPETTNEKPAAEATTVDAATPRNQVILRLRA